MHATSIILEDDGGRADWLVQFTQNSAFMPLMSCQLQLAPQDSVSLWARSASTLVGLATLKVPCSAARPYLHLLGALNAGENNCDRRQSPAVMRLF